MEVCYRHRYAFSCGMTQCHTDFKRRPNVLRFFAPTFCGNKGTPLTRGRLPMSQREKIKIKGLVFPDGMKLSVPSTTPHTCFPRQPQSHSADISKRSRTVRQRGHRCLPPSSPDSTGDSRRSRPYRIGVAMCRGFRHASGSTARLTATTCCPSAQKAGCQSSPRSSPRPRNKSPTW